MGKRTFWTSVVVGAICGGAISLINKDAKKYVKNTALTTIENLTFYYKNPKTGITEVKTNINSLNESVYNTSKSVINVLDQVETTVNKVTKKELE